MGEAAPLQAVAARPGEPPSLDGMLAARTVWRAARAPQADAPVLASGSAALDAWLPQQGWPRGALVELLLPADGIGEVALLLPLFARLTREGQTVVLVAPPYVPYAPAWQAAGVDLRRLEIVDATDARGALWAFEQCLRSAACAVVAGWPRGDAAALRRLQVAADAGDSLGIALRDRAHAANPSPAVLRLQGEAGQGAGSRWRALKSRGGQPPQRPFVQRAPGAMPAAHAAHAS